MDPEASGPSMRPWDQRSAKGLAYSGTPQTAPSSTSVTGTSGLRSSPSTSSPARWPWPSGSTTSPSPPATGPSLGQTVKQEQGFSQTISSPKKLKIRALLRLHAPHSDCDDDTFLVQKRLETQSPEKTVMDAAALKSSKTRGIFGHFRPRAVIF